MMCSNCTKFNQSSAKFCETCKIRLDIILFVCFHVISWTLVLQLTSYHNMIMVLLLLSGCFHIIMVAGRYLSFGGLVLRLHFSVFWIKINISQTKLIFKIVKLLQPKPSQSQFLFSSVKVEIILQK